MKLPIGWLNDYVSTEELTPEELADKLLSVGFEVEEIIRLGADIDRVVAGKILDIKKHIDADKLQVCMVDVGSEITTIVTGAQNIAQGNTVPVALDGARLPGGKEIHAAPLRGVMSYGMLCSGKELGVDGSVIEGAEADGILILPETTPGTDIKEILRLNETILDISVTANRPDCQSVYGMAREVAAVLGKKCKPLPIKYKTVSSGLKPHVEIRDEACSKYTCQVVENVKIQPSPQWMRDRLRYVGVRAINNVVDITNYVLFEVGQPLHAFDTKFVKDLGIIVRKAEPDEKITALDEKEYTLTERMTVIADSEKPLAIAGVMGGEHSGIGADTKTVLLEAARFAKGSVRATSRALGLRSDSSARYEKGVDVMSVDLGRERALALFSQLKAGTVTDAFAQGDAPAVSPKIIRTTVQKISDLLGIDVKQSVIVKILKSLAFEVETDGATLVVTVPLFREDVDNYTDLAEEVIRFYGYDNIHSTFMPTAKTTAGGIDTRQRNLQSVRAAAMHFGAYEITTYSFIGKKALDKLCLAPNDELRRQIEILNPLGEEYSVMRTQLAVNMLHVVSLNCSRKNKKFRLFEVGKTYIPHALPLTELPEERDTLCMAFVGSEENFYEIKAAADEIFRRFGVTPSRMTYGQKPYYHPGISCDYYVGDACICSLGKLHPVAAKNFDITDDVYLCEMDMHTFIENEPPITKFVPLPKYQAVERDLAVVVPEETPVGDILRTVQNANALCSQVRLFDIYRGEQIEKGHKSVAISFLLSAPDKTLNDAEITAIVDDILHALQTQCNATLR